MHFVLMGLRGSGKSTLGRRLAAARKRPFVDLDECTPAEMGLDNVAEAWALHGEHAFRRAEVAALAKVLALSPRVIALGGGTPTAPGAEALLRGSIAREVVRIAYLRGSAETLRARLTDAANTHRPSLTGSDVVAEVAQVLAARDPLYAALATDVVHIDGRSEDDVLSELLRLSEGS